MTRFLLVCILTYLALPIFGQSHTQNNTLIVNTLNGLHLRQQASTKSASKKLLPYGEQTKRRSITTCFLKDKEQVPAYTLKMLNFVEISKR